MLIGEYVRFKRAELGLTQEGLSERSGINRSYLSRLEKGHFKRPSLSVITKLSHALGVYAEEIIKFVDIDARIIDKNQLPPFEDYLRLKFGLGRGTPMFNEMLRRLFYYSYKTKSKLPPSETPFEQKMKLDFLSGMVDGLCEDGHRQVKPIWRDLAKKIDKKGLLFTESSFEEFEEIINSLVEEIRFIEGRLSPDELEAEAIKLRLRAKKMSTI